MGLQTEFSFTLPKGYIDREGTLHRHGTMRLATARDEIEPLRDPRVSGPDDPFLTILVISRVVSELGTVPRVTAQEIEGLFAADLAFLQDLYGIINFGDPGDVEALQRSVLRDVPVAASVPASAAPAALGEGHVTAMEPAGFEQDLPPRRRGQIEEVGSSAQA